jgi:dihydroxyacetone kinase-like protein
LATDFSQIATILTKLAEEVANKKEWLVELDSRIGDGDLGLTMDRGFSALAEESAKYEDKDIGKFFVKAGLVLNKVAPSTMGTLVSTAIMRMGKTWNGKTELTPEDIFTGFEAAVVGIKERGKSQLGDKTVLDALIPAVDALKEGLLEGKDLPNALRDAYQAALQGFEHTKEMQSKVGRASWFQEGSIGNPDPGAGLITVVFSVLAGEEIPGIADAYV